MLSAAWISTLFRGIWMYPAGGLSREAIAYREASEETCPANDPSEAFGADRDTSGTDGADTACRAGGSSGLDGSLPRSQGPRETDVH